MRTTFGALTVIGLVALIGFTSAQMSVPDNGIGKDDEPTSSSEPTATGAPPPPPPGGYFAKEGDKVSPTTRLDYDWQRVQIRATILGVNFNINQQARSYDSSADNWTQVFHLNAEFRDEDYVSFCGPQTSIDIEIRDTGTDKVTIYQGTLTGVPPCK